MRMPTRWRFALAGLLASAALGACGGTRAPTPTPVLTRDPPSPIPQLADPPTLRACYPDFAKARGLPGRVPVPRNAILHGPDRYAAPFEPAGQPPGRIAGRGFAFEASSAADVVAAFYDACLEAYGPDGWRRVHAEPGRAIFRIPVQGRRPAIVVVAGQPDGPTAVVLFVDHRITRRTA